MMNSSELSFKLRDLKKSQIRLIDSNQKGKWVDLILLDY